MSLLLDISLYYYNYICERGRERESTEVFMEAGKS